jgi:hypothetical protein
MAKLQKTSVQLSPMVLLDMDAWPGLTRSEAIRLSVERGHFLSTLNSDDISSLATEYDPILREALEDLDYEDYKVAARSLPQLVTGLLCEEPRGWRSDDGERQLDPSKLVEELEKLNYVQRISVLDCVVAERHRREEKRAAAKKDTPK